MKIELITREESIELITAPTIPDVMYYIENQPLTFKFPHFSYTQDLCGPLSLSLKLRNANGLPNLVKVSSDSMTVYSPLLSDLGTYLFSLKANANYFDPRSTIETDLKLIIDCKPITMTSSISRLEFTYDLGSSEDHMNITIEQFKL